MQIHELNDFNGVLDSSTFLVADNGIDTGKLSTVELLADLNATVAHLDSDLNERIDNIIAGPSSSAQETIDARRSADGINYASLGDAIRTQVGNLSEQVDSMILKKNLFNGNSHSGIHSQTTGATYGTFTPNGDFFYTDLMPLDGLSMLCIMGNMKGEQTQYVTFFDTDRKVVGSVNAFAPFIYSFPAGAVAFCVCARTVVLDSLLICPMIPGDNYSRNSADSLADNVAEKKYLRLDRGCYVGFYPYGTGSGVDIYPYVASTNLTTSYLIPLTGVQAVAYKNTSAASVYVHFLTDAHKVIGAATILNPYTEGTLVIPDNAVAFIWAASNGGQTRDVAAELCFVEGVEPPAEIYGFDDYTVENVNVTSETVIKGKKLLFTGDSITSGFYYNGGWVTMIGQAYDCNCDNEGHDGWTIGILPNRVDNLLELLPTLDDDYDYIVLSGGYNDFTTAPRADIGALTPYTYSALDTSTFCGSLESYIRTAKSKWKTAKICFVLTMKREFNDPTVSERQVTYWNLIRDCCKKYAIPLLDLYYDSGLVGVSVNGITDELTEYYYHNGDGTHPNEKGYRFLYRKIANFIMSL